MSLDGRQIAAIVIGALGVVVVVFVLGLNVGRQMAGRQLQLARSGDLDALDRVPATPAAAPGGDKGDITFYDKLPKGKPAAPSLAEPHPAGLPPAATTAPPQATLASAPPPSAAVPTPAVRAITAAPIPSAADGRVAAASAQPLPSEAHAAPPAPPAARPASKGSFAVQLAASADRAEAERLAARFKSAGARVEVADVPGKGRFYRVRVGTFATKAEAAARLRELERDSGAKGYVAPVR